MLCVVLYISACINPCILTYGVFSSLFLPVSPQWFYVDYGCMLHGLPIVPMHRSGLRSQCETFDFSV